MFILYNDDCISDVPVPELENRTEHKQESDSDAETENYFAFLYTPEGAEENATPEVERSPEPVVGIQEPLADQPEPAEDEPEPVIDTDDGLEEDNLRGDNTLHRLPWKSWRMTC